MRTKLTGSVVALLLLTFVSGHALATLDPPYDTEPFDTDTRGNSAANSLGFFRKDGGPEQFRYFIGTNPTADGPGRLIMDFTERFTDGPGDDFAILTDSQSWGELADEATFEFYLGDDLQGTFSASLVPDALLTFDLPGEGMVADRVVLINVTPDPPGTNDLATMTFDDAGVAYLTAPPDVPATSVAGAVVLAMILLAGGLIAIRR